MFHFHFPLIIPPSFLHVDHLPVTPPYMRLILNHLLFFRFLTKILLRIPLSLLSYFQFFHQSTRAIDSHLMRTSRSTPILFTIGPGPIKIAELQQFLNSTSPNTFIPCFTLYQTLSLALESGNIPQNFSSATKNTHRILI